MVFPKIIEEINIPYITALRERTMEYRDFTVRLHQLLPKFEVDSTEKKFKEAFKTEFGVDIDVLFDIQDRSIKYAYSICQPIVLMPKNYLKRRYFLRALIVSKYKCFITILCYLKMLMKKFH